MDGMDRMERQSRDPYLWDTTKTSISRSGIPSTAVNASVHCAPLYSTKKVRCDSARDGSSRLSGKDQQEMTRVCENCSRALDRAQNGNQGTCSMPSFFSVLLFPVLSLLRRSVEADGRWSSMLSLFSCCLQRKPSITTFVSVARNPRGANGGN